MESYAGYTISFAPISESKTLALAQCCKVCVAVFVFLSAYGITISFMKKERETDCTLRELYLDNFCRYIKLLSGFIVIYILAQIFSFLGRSNTEVYGAGMRKVVYIVLDLLGTATIFSTPTFNPTWWYMGLVITILLLLPLLYRTVRYIGVFIFPLSVVIPRMLGLQFTSLHWWLLTMCMGIWFAREGVFEKIHKIKAGRIGRFCKVILSAVLLLFMAYFRHKTGFFLDITDAFMAILIIYICFEVFAKSKDKVKYIAGFTGKYSMNMFLAHTFFKLYYFKDFTYSFQNAWLILLMLTITTLLFSVCVEKIKAFSGYNKMVGRLIVNIRQRYRDDERILHIHRDGNGIQHYGD